MLGRCWGCQGMYLGLAGTLGTHRPEGVWGIGGLLGGLGSAGVVLGASGGVKGVLGAGRDCRHSGARKYRGHWWLLGVLWGH